MKKHTCKTNLYKKEPIKKIVAKNRLPLHTNDCVYPFQNFSYCVQVQRSVQNSIEYNTNLNADKPANTYKERQKQYLQLLR